MSKLFTHDRHPHVPKNVNDVHAAERASGGFNQWLAIALTTNVGSMWTAYAFALLALVGLLGIVGVLSASVVLFIAWLSQTFIQLVLLPVIMVGQNVLNRKSELQAEEEFQTTQHSFHDIEEIMKHLDKQDEIILAILQKLENK